MVKKLILTLIATILLSIYVYAQNIVNEISNPIIQNLIDNMVFIEGGTFLMGGTIEQDSEPSDFEQPIHEETLSSFSIGKYEVTQEEWEAVMGENPSRYLAAKHPVEQVSYRDCHRFIRKLNKLTGVKFRLPTEAEWEFASRGGNQSNRYKYAGGNDITKVAWMSNDSSDGTHDVGLKEPNELGLFDMSGNVWEWCSDMLGEYSEAPQTNPKGAGRSSFYVFRGGSWENESWYCRVSVRYGNLPRIRSVNLGLRLAL